MSSDNGIRGPPQRVSEERGSSTMPGDEATSKRLEPFWGAVPDTGGASWNAPLLSKVIEDRDEKVLAVDDLLRKLAALSGSAPPAPGDVDLPVDFRIQLQLLESVTEQSCLLKQVSHQLEVLSSQEVRRRCEADTTMLQLTTSMAEQSSSLKQVSNQITELRAEVWRKEEQERNRCLEMKELALETEGSFVPLEAFSHMQGCEEAGLSSAPIALQPRRLPSDIRTNGAGSTPSRRVSRTPRVREEATADPEVHRLSTVEIRAEKGFFHRIVSHPAFDFVSMIVVLANAVTIGINAEESINYALRTGGGSEFPEHTIYKTLEKAYITFYVVEIIVKLVVLRAEFFNGPLWNWNCFDLVLIGVGIYDILSDVLDLKRMLSLPGTWLRLLKMLKMLKLLRVVRVLRFFKVLRNMMSSIVSSVGTLFWSLIMIAIMLYIFGLCFLQAVYGHLSGTPNISKTELDAIEQYWCSVHQAIISLYMGVTGGADWEQLAFPIKQADGVLYHVFLFYIAFATIAVLNVLTGMFVDAAMTVSKSDEINVIEELRQMSEVTAFREYFRSRSDFCGNVTTKSLKECIRKPVGMNYMRSLGFDERGLVDFFHRLDVRKSRKVDLEELIYACLRECSGKPLCLTTSLMSEAKKASKQQTLLMQYVEDCFMEVFDLLRRDEVPEDVPTLQERLQRQHVLPPDWSHMPEASAERA